MIAEVSASVSLRTLRTHSLNQKFKFVHCNSMHCCCITHTSARAMRAKVSAFVASFAQLLLRATKLLHQ